MSPEEFLADCKSLLSEEGVLHHAFLKRVSSEVMTTEQMRVFFSHWYQMSKSHREAFPCLIANILDDQIRFDLVGILYEEYGDGNRDKIHGKILERALCAIGIDKSFALRVHPMGSTTRFSETVRRVWLFEAHPLAYGLHYGLEFLATEQQKYFATGMLQYDFLSESDREYFEIHAEAEVRHVSESELGLATYARNIANQSLLVEGMVLAKNLLKDLWDEMDEVVFGQALAAKQSTCQDPAIGHRLSEQKRLI